MSAVNDLMRAYFGAADGLHPTYDPATGVLVNGWTGYGNYHDLWSRWLQDENY